MATDDLHRPGAHDAAPRIVVRKRAFAARLGAPIACLSLALLLGLCGCGAFEAPQAGEEEHTLCYTRLATSPDQLHTLAKTSCSGAEPRYDKQATDVSACPLLVPERLYFSCTE